MDYRLRGNLRWGGEWNIILKSQLFAHPCENRDLPELREFPACAGMSGEFELGFLISETPPPLRPRGLFVCRAGGKGITCVQVKGLEVCAFIIQRVF